MSALITFVALLCAAPSALAVKLINVEDLSREGEPGCPASVPHIQSDLPLLPTVFLFLIAASPICF